MAERKTRAAPKGARAETRRAPASAAAPSANLAEIGLTGLNHDRYAVREEFLPRLYGTAGVKAFREMRDNSAMVGAFSLAQETLIRQAPWKTVRPLDTPEAHEAEELVESARHDMEQTWQELLSEVISFAIFGWSAFEKVYKIRRGMRGDGPARSKHDDGKLGWLGLNPRAQESLLRWDFDDNGRVKAMLQAPAPDFRTRTIPRSKLLIFRPRSAKNNPEGRSLIRNAWRSWEFEKRIEEIEAVGIARDLAGMVIARVPPDIMHPDATAPQKRVRTQAEQMAAKIDRNEYSGLVYAAKEIGQDKTGYDIELLSSGGSRQIDTNEIVKRYESRILISVLAEFLMLGMDAKGSFALADTKTNVFAMSLGAILASICDVLNNDAVPELCRLNGFEDPSIYPEIQHGDIETPDLQMMSNFVAALINARALRPSALLERFLAEYGGLPTPETPMPEPADPPPAPDPQAPPTNLPAIPAPAPMPAPASPPNGAPNGAPS